MEKYDRLVRVAICDRRQSSRSRSDSVGNVAVRKLYTVLPALRNPRVREHSRESSRNLSGSEH